jgi:hypothetical protein
MLFFCRDSSSRTPCKNFIQCDIKILKLQIDSTGDNGIQYNGKRTEEIE